MVVGSFVGEKELAVLEEISRGDDPSQRRIARSASLSLGMVNLIVRSLVRKGYVKASRLNKKKVRYILTPAGAAEKTRKAYASLQKTMELVRFLKGRVHRIVESRGGAPGAEVRPIALAGAGEAADIAELALREAGVPFRRIAAVGEARAGELVLAGSRSALAGRVPDGAAVVELALEMARAPERKARVG